MKCKWKDCSKNPVEKAMACEKCSLLLCESHTKNQENLIKCPNPKCGVEPLKVRIEINIRAIVDQMLARCEYCNKRIKKDELNNHILKHCTKCPHCYFNGCNDTVTTKEAALKHIAEKHSDIIWNNFHSNEIKFPCRVISSVSISTVGKQRAGAFTTV